MAKLEAEKHCRKIHVGNIPWTPGLTVTIYKILYWQGIRKQILDGKICGEVLRKWAKQGKETFFTEHLQLSVEVVKQKLKQVTQDYKMIKKTCDQQDTWLGQMITAQAEAKNI